MRMQKSSDEIREKIFFWLGSIFFLVLELGVLLPGFSGITKSPKQTLYMLSQTSDFRPLTLTIFSLDNN